MIGIMKDKDKSRSIHIKRSQEVSFLYQNTHTHRTITEEKQHKHVRWCRCGLVPPLGYGPPVRFSHSAGALWAALGTVIEGKEGARDMEKSRVKECEAERRRERNRGGSLYGSAEGHQGRLKDFSGLRTKGH